MKCKGKPPEDLSTSSLAQSDVHLTISLAAMKRLDYKGSRLGGNRHVHMVARSREVVMEGLRGVRFRIDVCVCALACWHTTFLSQSQRHFSGLNEGYQISNGQNLKFPSHSSPY